MRRSQFIAAGATALATGAGFGRGRAAVAPQHSVRGNMFSLDGAGIAATWTTDAGAFRMVALSDRISGRAIPLPRNLFSLTFADGTNRKTDDFTIVHGPVFEEHAGDPTAARFSDRLGATVPTVVLADRATGARITWRAIAGADALYLRQELTIEATQGPLAIRDVRAIDFPSMPDARVVGTCDGSPIVAGSVYFAVEHPFAQSDALFDHAYASYPSKVDVRPGIPLVVSSVIGATSPGQLRRDFLTYVERERAHPYRTFLHYNSWYDIGYFTRYDQDDCLSRIHAFGEELHTKRGIALASFLFDDGWDDPEHLWEFNAGFPRGFAPLRAAAAQYGARPGAWLSPWGGYGEPHTQRLTSAKRLGYETDEDGLALAGPKYFERFHAVVMEFIEQGGVNHFKIDGTGNAATSVPGSRFGSDFEAAIALIGDMRAAEPDIYVNLTTGTYPSPFWLRYCDSIWRGGDDHDFTGVGSPRQQWITYRDADTYAGIVNTGPLYPINSLMLHGLIYAQHAEHLGDDPFGDFRNEIHSYFGSGTQLQEMYITPNLLSAGNWNDIAEAAAWSAGNADVLRDTHWVGGNPARLDIYGWASWSSRKGILVLRNPSNRTQSIPVDIGSAFELPPQAPRTYRARSPWKGTARDTIRVRSGSEHLFTLEPFEVCVLEMLGEAT